VYWNRFYYLGKYVQLKRRNVIVLYILDAALNAESTESLKGSTKSAETPLLKRKSLHKLFPESHNNI
jgi:hypothetical protein